jgi:protein O-GlcNAc transferase
LAQQCAGNSLDFGGGQNGKSFDSVSHAVFRDTIFEMNHLFAESQEHHRTGFQLLSEGTYAKAREQFLKAIEKNPYWASPYLGLGQTFFLQNNPNLKEATKAFRHVVELKPEWVEGYHWLGSAQEKIGALEEAVTCYREAIRIAPSDTRPLISLGVCLTQLKRFTDAIACLRHAISLKPPYAIASAHLFLADAQRANGQIDAACKEWQLVLDLPSEYPEYNSAKKEATQRLSEYRNSSPDRHRKR